jgi:hypothetical protein
MSLGTAYDVGHTKLKPAAGVEYGIDRKILDSH